MIKIKTKHLLMLLLPLNGIVLGLLIILLIVNSNSIDSSKKTNPEYQSIKETNNQSQVAGEYTTQATGNVYNKKALVIIFNPVFSNGKKLNEYMGWNNPYTLLNSYINWYKETTYNKVNYSSFTIQEINDFPTFTDGRKYDQTSYLACWNDNSKCLKDDYGNLLGTDYSLLLRLYNVCEGFNLGNYNELWMFGAPYMGWWEANQAGNRAFGTNGPVISGTTCNKPLNIMGFSYERGLSEMVEDMMHRIEGTMSTAYGSWAENSISTNWNKFAMDAKQSPSYGYSGCGNCHYAPNSESDYDWSNPRTITSFCDEFNNYPDTIDTNERATISCNTWGCTSLGYFRWWMRHLPSKTGIAPDNHYADWWKYILEPLSVYDSLQYVPPTNTPTPTYSPTPTNTPTLTPTVRVTLTNTPVPTTTIPVITATKTATPTPTVTVTVTNTPVPTTTSTITTAPNITVTKTTTPTPTITSNNIISVTPSISPILPTIITPSYEMILPGPSITPTITIESAVPITEDNNTSDKTEKIQQQRAVGVILIATGTVTSILAIASLLRLRFIYPIKIKNKII